MSRGRARARGFGTLAINSENGPLVSHIPFIIAQDGQSVELHLVRSNPIVALLKKAPVQAVIAVTGGDAYISPDWYGIEDQVPTWNYVAVHLRGTLALLNNDELHGVLNRLSAEMESRLMPKSPWTSDKMDETTYHRMLRQIVPARMQVTQINGTWKLSQNKPDNVRLSAAKELSKTGFGSEVGSIVDGMQD